MKRIVSTALAALLLVGAPLAVYAQAESGAAGMEQPSGKKAHKAKKGHKKGKKKESGAEGAPATK